MSWVGGLGATSADHNLGNVRQCAGNAPVSSNGLNHFVANSVASIGSFGSIASGAEFAEVALAQLAATRALSGNAAGLANAAARAGLPGANMPALHGSRAAAFAGQGHAPSENALLDTLVASQLAASVAFATREPSVSEQSQAVRPPADQQAFDHEELQRRLAAAADAPVREDEFHCHALPAETDHPPVAPPVAPPLPVDGHPSNPQGAPRVAPCHLTRVDWKGSTNLEAEPSTTQPVVAATHVSEEEKQAHRQGQVKQVKSIVDQALGAAKAAAMANRASVSAATGSKNLSAADAKTSTPQRSLGGYWVPSFLPHGAASAGQAATVGSANAVERSRSRSRRQRSRDRDRRLKSRGRRRRSCSRSRSRGKKKVHRSSIFTDSAADSIVANFPSAQRAVALQPSRAAPVPVELSSMSRKRVIQLPKAYIKSLLGVGGETIRYIVNRTGANVQVKSGPSDRDGIVTIDGVNVDLAEQVIYEVLATKGCAIPSAALQVPLGPAGGFTGVLPASAAAPIGGCQAHQ